MKTLKNLMEKHPKLSLKRICDETGLCYQYVLKASKQPITGKAYDPNEFNYAAAQKIIEKRELDLNKFDWAKIEESVKTFEPISEIKEFIVGAQFKMRAAQDLCEIVYLNADEAGNVTEVVFIDRTTAKCRVMNVDTFAHQSPRIIKKDA